MTWVVWTAGLYQTCQKTQTVSTVSSWWFQPVWKKFSQIGNMPQVGVKIKNIWNHHLVSISKILLKQIKTNGQSKFESECSSSTNVQPFFMVSCLCLSHDGSMRLVYLPIHLPYTSTIHVGKCISPVDPLGFPLFCFVLNFSKTKHPNTVHHIPPTLHLNQARHFDLSVVHFVAKEHRCPA